MGKRIVRGGSWGNNPRGCRSAACFSLSPRCQLNYFGFRVVCDKSEMDIIEQLGNDVSLELVQVPGGSFLMGSPESEPGRYEDEGPQHEVRISAFAMGRYPVTQAQWLAVMGDDPSYFKGANRPVECVSWNDAVAFCERLSKQSGKTYRLPSEAEWEYACRAGTTTPYFFGESLEKNQANYGSDSTTDVGSFPANDFGLYDMHGNVWEWCEDRWHDNYQGAPTDGSAWITGGRSSQRGIRGGSWPANPRNCRSAHRDSYGPDYRNNNIGFRVALNGL